MRREADFDNDVTTILRKNMREEREMMWWRERERERERERIEFWWGSYLNFCPKCKLPRRSAEREKKKRSNCGNKVAEIVEERKEKKKN